jgi:pimeloyl-ACP methyl ester carboxylesterase
MRTETIELPGGRFQLLRAGAAGAPLVIVLHGFPDHPPTFAPVIEALAAGGYDVVAPWLRGYAPSTLAGPFHATRLAEDVLELATALGHERFAIVGHDWGAVITYATCALAPDRVRAAVTMAVPHPLAFLRSFTRTAQLVRSWYMVFFQLPGAIAVARARDLALIDRLWRRWSPGYRLPDADRRALHDCLGASMPAPILYYRSQARWTPELMKPLTTPLLQLQGADDGCIAPSAARGQARYFRGPFEEAVIPGAGHFLQAERPGEIAALCLSWLRR